MEETPQKFAEYADIDELFNKFDQALRSLRKDFVANGLRHVLYKRFDKNDLEKWEEYVKQNGTMPPIEMFDNEAQAKCWIVLQELSKRDWEMAGEMLRASVASNILEQAGYRQNAFIAYERAILADHARRNVEKRHQNSIKAKFQQDAIQKWQATNGKKSRVAFSLQYRDELKAKHRIDLDYRTIAEDWLKDH